MYLPPLPLRGSVCLYQFTLYRFHLYSYYIHTFLYFHRRTRRTERGTVTSRHQPVRQRRRSRSERSGGSSPSSSSLAALRGPTTNDERVVGKKRHVIKMLMSLSVTPSVLDLTMPSRFSPVTPCSHARRVLVVFIRQSSNIFPTKRSLCFVLAPSVRFQCDRTEPPLLPGATSQPNFYIGE